MIFLLEERLRGHWQLQRSLAQATKEGEKLTIEALAAHPTPEALKNGAKLEAAGIALRKIADEKHFLHTSIGTRVTADGMASFTDSDSVGPFNSLYLSDPKMHRITWDEFHGFLELGSKEMATVEQTARLPLAIIGTPEKMLEFGAGKGVLSTMEWLRGQFILHRHEQDRQKCLADLVTAEAISKAAGGAWTNLGQSMALGGESSSIFSAWMALQMKGWNDSELAEMQRLFQNPQSAPNLQAYLQMERARECHQFEMVRTFADTRFFVLYQPDPADFEPDSTTFITGPSVPKRLRVWAKGMVWKLAFSEQDELRSLQQWAPVLQETQKLLTGRNWSAARLDFPYFSLSEAPSRSLRFGVGQYFEQGFADVAGNLKLWVKIETERELLNADLALCRYQLQHGEYPARLEALVPEFLSALPHDWMNGQALQYRRKGDGDFLLYSVGIDGIDDGGNALPSDPKKWPRIFEGRDMVWPRLTPI